MMIGTSIIGLEYLFLIFSFILSVASIVDSKSAWKPKKIAVTEEVLANVDFEIVTVAQTLCLAIANSQSSSFIACFNEEEGRCFGYSGEVVEDSNPSNDWICSRCDVRCEKDVPYVEGIGCLHFTPNPVPLSSASSSFCPTGASLFSPTSLEEYEVLRVKLVEMKSNSYPVPDDVHIAVERDANANAWVNTFTRQVLVSQPSTSGSYPFGIYDPNDYSDCMALTFQINYQYHWMDISCTSEYHAICIEKAI